MWCPVVNGYNSEEVILELLLSRTNETMRKAKQETILSDENMAQTKKKHDTCCNPFKFTKDEKDAEEKYGVPLVDLEPETRETATYVYAFTTTAKQAKWQPLCHPTL